ncbi:AAA ATPase domain-containing protein [Streptomyces griseoaurantiacus]|nr:AAA ATPase domain-containing protein [Streptomyces jietaisiensis]
MTEEPPDAVPSASLWEREEELRAVSAAVDALRAESPAGAPGPGSVLVLTGEAGFGKTALLTEIRARAEKLGCTV